jgi:drug/metabolite transporter superfamily protein YnfA
MSFAWTDRPGVLTRAIVGQSIHFQNPTRYEFIGALVSLVGVGIIVSALRQRYGEQAE